MVISGNQTMTDVSTTYLKVIILYFVIKSHKIPDVFFQ